MKTAEEREMALRANDSGSGVRLAVVYVSEDNWFYSDGVQLEFGQNKAVKLLNGESVFCSVHPLKCEPLACGLRIAGTIRR